LSPGHQLADREGDLRGVKIMPAACEAYEIVGVHQGCEILHFPTVEVGAPYEGDALLHEQTGTRDKEDTQHSLKKKPLKNKETAPCQGTASRRNVRRRATGLSCTIERFRFDQGRANRLEPDQ